MKLPNPSPAGESLPTKNDFNPWGPDALDAEYAWKVFGGLTLGDARMVFLDCPDSRQEDFMFMGGKAFAYYFPIIEDYLREVRHKKTEGEDRQSWILAQCILHQFGQSTRGYVLHLALRIVALSRFVQENIQRFGDGEEEQREIARAWAEVESCVRPTEEFNR